MHARILPRRSALAAAFTAGALFALSAETTMAQVRDARLPAPGRLWLEFSPVFWNWSEQFALDSPLPDSPDGAREPLFADLDGPIAARLFPGPSPFIDDLNLASGALGFDPVDASDFSLGSLDFSAVNAERRTLDLGFEMGILSRLAVGFHAPIVMTDFESRFAFDSLGASVTHGDLGFGAGNLFFSEARAAVISLDGLIAGGTLMGAELANAMALRDQTDAYITAFESRVAGGGLIPTAPSTAGVQMSDRFASFVVSFEALGLALPALALPMAATAADLPRWFQNEPVAGMLPRGLRRGLTLGEAELSVRFGVIDQITRRSAGGAPPVEPRTGDPAPDPPAAGAPPDSVTGEAVTEAGTEPGTVDDGRRGIRLRTTVGVLLRLPAASASGLPNEEPTDFVGIPIGDGQRDVELSVFQDVAFGEWLLLRAAARYGIQMADDVILRVHPPDRPYAFASTMAVVHRDLGDYFQLLLRPAISLNSAISVGLEYDYWRLSEGVYSIADPLPDSPAPDATPLSVETSQSRHMVGVGITYDMSNARTREDLAADRTPVRSPWLFNLSIRRSVAGSGGQTPAAFMYAASFRFPIRVF